MCWPAVSCAGKCLSLRRSSDDSRTRDADERRVSLNVRRSQDVSGALQSLRRAFQ